MAVLKTLVLIEEKRGWVACSIEPCPLEELLLPFIEGATWDVAVLPLGGAKSDHTVKQAVRLFRELRRRSSEVVDGGSVLLESRDAG